MKRILIENGKIIQGDRIFKGHILVEDGKIVTVGEAPIPTPDGMDAVLDATGKMVLPGLVNAHIHSYGNLVRGLTPADTLESWMLYIQAQGRLMTEEDCYWNALLGALEMIKSGTTCCIDHLAQPFEGLDAAMHAYGKAGLRCVMAPMVADRPYFASLAVEPTSFPASYYQEAVPSAQRLMETTGALLKKWHSPKGLLQVGYGPSGPQRCTDELLALCAKGAEANDTIVHTHVLESEWQAVSTRRLYPEGMLWHLDRLGLLNARLCFAHGVFLEEDEIRLVADRGSCVVHNPAANFLLGSGIAPVEKYLRHGARVALGTDGANGSGSLNMFESIKDLAMIHTISPLNRGNRRRWVTPQQALSIATEKGAEACGLRGVTGRIEPGYAADLVLLDPMRSPRLSVPNDPYWQLVYTNPEECVDTVLIDGELVLQNRQFVNLCEESILREGARRAEKLRERFEKQALPEVLLKKRKLDRYFAAQKYEE